MSPAGPQAGPAEDPAPVIVGVDIGTTATKAVAFTAAGELVAGASAEYPLEEPRPGRAEQDPELILGAVLECLRSVVREVGAPRVAGLSFGAAMHSLLGLAADGRPLTPLVTWADARAGEQAERLRAGAGGLALHRRTGTPVHPMSPLTKLVWFREERPQLCARVACWAGIKEFVLLRLCGELVTDHSVASATGLMNLQELDWDAEALELAGVTPARLPRLVPTTEVLPGLTAGAARATGLPAATPVVVGAGDGPLANLGLGAVRPGVVACSIGTSGALRVVVDRPVVDPRGQVFCYALTPGRWVVGGAVNNGGVVLGWAGDALAPELGDEPEEELLALAERVPAGAGGLVMLPYLLGERAPRWTSVPRGAYVGLTRAHRREHLVRAALEGVCQQLALVLDSMRATGLAVEQVRATGGFARSPLWRQLLADVLGLDVRFAEGHDGSGFGAALLGMQALGLVASVDVAAELVQVDATVRPRPADAAVHAALRPVFEGLHDALVPAFTALRQLAPSLPLEPGPGLR
ncbi:gluconokinase [Kocuria sp. U4B]